MTKEKKIVLITGASKGIGKEIAIKLAEQGCKVWATMREPNLCKWIKEVPSLIKSNISLNALDVTDNDSVVQAVENILQKDKRLDVVVNNAGYGLFAPVELACIDEIEKQFNVNFLGAVRVIQAVLPSMRENQSGKIINISSLAGVVSNPLLGIYSATKHALEAVSASLAATVFPWNIKVVLVEPGSTKTGFAEASHVGNQLEQENPYKLFSSLYIKEIKESLAKGQLPQEIAALVGKIINLENPDFRYQTSDRGKEIVKNILVNPSGNEWLQEQEKRYSNWFLKK